MLSCVIKFCLKNVLSGGPSEGSASDCDLGLEGEGREVRYTDQVGRDFYGNVTTFVSEECFECFPIRSTRMTAQTAMTCSSKCRVYQVGLNLFILECMQKSNGYMSDKGSWKWKEKQQIRKL